LDYRLTYLTIVAALLVIGYASYQYIGFGDPRFGDQEMIDTMRDHGVNMNSEQHFYFAIMYKSQQDAYQAKELLTEQDYEVELELFETEYDVTANIDMVPTLENIALHADRVRQIAKDTGGKYNDYGVIYREEDQKVLFPK